MTLAVTTAGGSTPTARAQPGRRRALWLMLAVMAVVAALFPLARLALPAEPGFAAIVLTAIVCGDLACAVFLSLHFRGTGHPRALAMAWAYVYALVLAIGYGGAFPGILSGHPPLYEQDSTAGWLWVVWHGGFPLLLAFALMPWPRRWRGTVAAGSRVRWLTASLTACAVAAVLVVAATVWLGRHLPVIVQGQDLGGLAEVAGPYLLAVIVVAAVVVLYGSTSADDLGQYAVIAVSAMTGDVLLTIAGEARYTLGWYGGRMLTLVSAAAVVVALFARFGAIQRRLAAEGEELRAVLERTGELERQQGTLLRHMTDGVVMFSASGQVMASNPAAQRLLELDESRLKQLRVGEGPWHALRPDGTPWLTDTPVPTTFRTGQAQRDQVMGLHLSSGRIVWVSMSTETVPDPSGGTGPVVVTMTDVTERHAAQIEAAKLRLTQRARVQQVLDAGGPQIVFQPIVRLADGVVVGAEALSRFADVPVRSPDVWFAEAAAVGLGTELELAAIASSLASLDELPPGSYLSINVSPATLVDDALLAMLADVIGDRVVVELTEHVDIPDYGELEDALHRLRTLGMRVAVDDAGSGYASLRHILHLAPDIIKIDIALVRGINTSPSRRALAASLVTFAQQTGALIVAEGIETQAELETLTALGISHGQGYHLGRPAPLPLATRCPLAPTDVRSAKGVIGATMRHG